MSRGSGTLDIRRRSRQGKTFRVSLELREGRVVSFTLSGDFFAYPAESLDEIGEEVAGLEPSEFIKVVESRLKEVELAGVDKKELMEAIKELLSPFLGSHRRRT